MGVSGRCLDVQISRPGFQGRYLQTRNFMCDECISVEMAFKAEFKREKRTNDRLRPEDIFMSREIKDEEGMAREPGGPKDTWERSPERSGKLSAAAHPVR